MSSRQKYLKVLSELSTGGAVGVALILGGSAPATANQLPSSRQPSAAQGERVSERLAAIREAVSTLSAAGSEVADPTPLRRLAWGNWGWGRPWANFGWGGPWSNWNNWRNGWPNWRNGWLNW